MKLGDVVLVRFPQSDLTTGKLRPALTVAVAPGRHPDLLLALITSRTYQGVQGFDEIIKPTDPDYAMTRLRSGSIVRLARLASVESSVITARLGSISSERLHLIRQRLAEWLQD